MKILRSQYKLIGYLNSRGSRFVIPIFKGHNPKIDGFFIQDSSNGITIKKFIPIPLQDNQYVPYDSDIIVSCKNQLVFVFQYGDNKIFASPLVGFWDFQKNATLSKDERIMIEEINTFYINKSAEIYSLLQHGFPRKARNNPKKNSIIVSNLLLNEIKPHAMFVGKSRIPKRNALKKCSYRKQSSRNIKVAVTNNENYLIGHRAGLKRRRIKNIKGRNPLKEV